MTKTVYFVRHGYALHNMLFHVIGTDAYKIRDTQLLAEGVEQAKNLGNTWDNINNIEIVVCSPLTRTLDTATLVFKNTNHKIIALDSLLEYPLGTDENCNQRKDKNVLQSLYPHVDFSLIQDDVFPWKQNNETIEELQMRANTFVEWIKTRPEKHICAVSHSSYISNIINDVIGDEYNELKHCFPYEYKIGV